jgi:hypothetical protein
MSPSPTFLNDLVKVIDKLVKNINKNRKSKLLLEMCKSMDSVQFTRELCSIRIGLPRRSGNTTLALKLLKKYPGSIYVGMSSSQVKAVANTYKGKISDRKRFFSVNMAYIGKDFIGKSPLIVITDCLEYASKEVVDSMYRELCHAQPVYINVG